MKKIIVKNVVKTEGIKIPTGPFASDWFKCPYCGYTVQMKVLGNHATCSKCGKLMVRQ